MATVNEGRDNVAQLIVAGQTGNEYDSVAIGSDGTAVSDTDSSLVTTVDSETGLTGSVNGNTASLVATFTNNSASIREASMYHSASGNMLARQVLDTINVESGDTLELTWNVNVSDA